NVRGWFHSSRNLSSPPSTRGKEKPGALLSPRPDRAFRSRPPIRPAPATASRPWHAPCAGRRGLGEGVLTCQEDGPAGGGGSLGAHVRGGGSCPAHTPGPTR